MADTLTIALDPKTAAELRRLADENGETVEAAAERVIRAATHTESLLSPEQVEELRRRAADPGPIATDEEVEAFFSRFDA